MIITPEDIRSVRPISENVNDVKRLIPYIEEAEKIYLIKAIGAVKYKELEADKPNFENFTLLMDGGYYDDDKVYFSGLRSAMGYLVYGRFVRNQNINATAFGIVAKQGQFSEQVDEKTIVRISNDAEKTGLEFLKQCVDFLNFGKDRSQQRVVNQKCRFKSIGD